MAVLQQFSLTWTQKRVHHEDDEVVEFAEVELRPLWWIISQVTAGLEKKSVLLGTKPRSRVLGAFDGRKRRDVLDRTIPFCFFEDLANQNDVFLQR